MAQTEPSTRRMPPRSIPAAAVHPAAVLAGVAAAAWAALVAGAGRTQHDDVLGAGHAPGPAAVAALLGGWLVMAAAMMLPPQIASARSRAARPGRRWSEAGSLTVATCAVWLCFGVVAGTGDAAVHVLAAPRPVLADLVAPAVLVGAGAFQFSAVRRRLLAAARRENGSPWRHALLGLGSCGGLMLVAFALGAGTLPAMALLTVVMTAERVASPRLERLTGRLVGWALVGAGTLVAVQPGLIH